MLKEINYRATVDLLIESFSFGSVLRMAGPAFRRKY
jgi:hypothetical protein